MNAETAYRQQMRNLDLIIVRTEALRDDVRLRDHSLQPRSGGAGK